jgi:tetratricopeptide (TPR) repeat protein
MRYGGFGFGLLLLVITTATTAVAQRASQPKFDEGKKVILRFDLPDSLRSPQPLQSWAREPFRVDENLFMTSSAPNAQVLAYMKTIDYWLSLPLPIDNTPKPNLDFLVALQEEMKMSSFDRAMIARSNGIAPNSSSSGNVPTLTVPVFSVPVADVIAIPGAVIRGVADFFRDAPPVPLGSVMPAREPRSDSDFVQWGLYNLAHERAKGALENFSRAIDLNPSCLTAYLWRAQTYQQYDYTDLAIDDYTSILNLAPRFPKLNIASVYLERGKLFAKTKNIPAAKSDFLMVQSLGSSDADSLLDELDKH